MDISCVGDGGLLWSSNKWSLLDVRGSSEQLIQACKYNSYVFSFYIAPRK